MTTKKLLFERLRRPLGALQRFFSISENTFLIILAVVIGLLGGLGYYAFRQTTEFVHWAVFEQSEQLFGYSMEEWSLARLALVLCPVVGGWGKTDLIYGHHGERLASHLDALGVEHDVKTYPDVGHSYMNNHDSFIFRELGDHSPLRSKYNETAAEDSWQRVFSFFEKVLAA